jgi:hypothetical protein
MLSLSKHTGTPFDGLRVSVTVFILMNSLVPEFCMKLTVFDKNTSSLSLEIHIPLYFDDYGIPGLFSSVGSCLHVHHRFRAKIFLHHS